MGQNSQQDGLLITYPRTSISAFVSRSLRPVISSLGLENVTDFAYTDSVIFILRLTDRDVGKGLYKRFHDLASDNAHRYSFGVISRDPEDGPSSLDCFNNLDDVTLSTTDFFSHIFSLDEFLTSCATRLVTEMTHLNEADFIEVSHLPSCIILKVVRF